MELSTKPLDWMFEISFWVADGASEPNVPWPDNWEVCAVPAFDPFTLTEQPKRSGQTWMAWPMYAVSDPVPELDAVCSFLERMSEDALQDWLSIPDRHLSLSCADLEMDFAQMNTNGFALPAALIRRIRHLRLRLEISFHPNAQTRWSFSY